MEQINYKRRRKKTPSKYGVLYVVFNLVTPPILISFFKKYYIFQLDSSHNQFLFLNNEDPKF
jgi:hypothetical protein